MHWGFMLGGAIGATIGFFWGFLLARRERDTVKCIVCGKRVPATVRALVQHADAHEDEEGE